MAMVQTHRRKALSRVFSRLVYGKDIYSHHHFRLCEQECAHVKECYDVLVCALDYAYKKGIYARGKYEEILHRMECALRQMTEHSKESFDRHCRRFNGI